MGLVVERAEKMATIKFCLGVGEGGGWVFCAFVQLNKLEISSLYHK